MVTPKRGSSENYISRRIAAECGFIGEPDSRIDAVLKLGQDRRICSLLVREMEPDLVLMEEFVLLFHLYRPGDGMYDHLHQSSTGDQSKIKAARFSFVFMGLSC